MNLRHWLHAWRPKIREFSDTYLQVRSQLNPSLVRWLPNGSRSQLTLLLAHFPSTFLQLQTACELAQVPYSICTEPLTPAVVGRWWHSQVEAQSLTAPLPHVSAVRSVDATAGPLLVLALVDQLQTDSAASSGPVGSSDGVLRPQEPGRATSRKDRMAAEIGLPASARLAVLVAERHFLRAQDGVVHQFVRQLDCRVEVAFFVALDDVLLRGRCDRMLWQLLEHYGMRPNEPWQSHLLDRLVRRVQGEYARQNPPHFFAESPDHWLERRQASWQ